MPLELQKIESLELLTLNSEYLATIDNFLRDYHLVENPLTSKEFSEIPNLTSINFIANDMTDYHIFSLGKNKSNVTKIKKDSAYLMLYFTVKNGLLNKNSLIYWNNVYFGGLRSHKLNEIYSPQDAYKLNLNDVQTSNNLDQSLVKKYWEELIVLALGKLYVSQTSTYYDDFPIPGICFKEIYNTMKDYKRFELCADLLAMEIRYKGWDKQATKIGMPQAKGFIWGSILAEKQGLGCIMMRKPNKLPASETVKKQYTLQYGTDQLEVLKTVIEPDDKIIIVDDCVATGGSLRASIDLFYDIGIPVVGGACVIVIPEEWHVAGTRFPEIEILNVL